MLELLYFVVWQCLFLCWSAYDQLQKIFSRLHSVLSWSYDRCGGEVDAAASVSAGRAPSLIVAAKERQFLQKCKNDLTKLPKHLSVIVGPEAYQVKELLIQKLFTYANIMDIDFISLYDTRPPNKGYIDVEHMKVPKGVQFKVIEENYFQWCSVECDDELSNNVGSNGYKMKSNGYVTESNGCEVNGNSKKRDYSVHKKLEVYQITEADCRPMLAKVCRELFTKRHTPEVQKLLRGEREHLTQYITEQLRHRLNAPEPELCILLHKDLCTFGLLPWQTRFTEFYAHDPQSGQFSAQDFASLLYKYSNCEQRWGK